MADADLMNFDPEGGGPEYEDENDENEAPAQAPSLVGSPVIMNSILKQSTKDNLIQLYTPVQKPEKGKLKVHFGRDSLLETPDIKQKKRVNLRDSIGEEKPADGHGKGDQQKLPDVTDGATSRGSGPTQQQSASNQPSNNSEEVAMETSICEIQNSLEPDLDSRVLDILSSTDAFLKSLSTPQPTESIREVEEPTPASEATTGVASVGSSCDSSRIATVSVEGTIVSEAVNNATDIGMDSVHSRSELKRGDDKLKDVNSETAQTEEHEPMDCEEAIDVDDEDNEVIFNLKKPASDTDIVEEVKDESEDNIDTKKLPESEEKHVETKLNEIKNVAHDKTVEEEKAVNSENENAQTAVATEQVLKTEDIVKQEGNETKQENTNMSASGEKVKSDDVSDEDEFMSADEEMGVDATTLAKKVQEQVREQSPPLKTPPKVGYSTDFDNLNLDAVDPFATKKGLMNSPDLVGQAKPKTLKVPEKAKSDKAKTEKETETNNEPVRVPEKQMPKEKLKDKIVSSSEESQETNENAEEVKDKVENVSVEKDQLQQTQPEEKSVHDYSNKGNLKTKECETVQVEKKDAEPHTVPEEGKPNEDKNCSPPAPVVDFSSPAIPVTRGAYNLDFLDQLDEVDPSQPKTQIMNSPCNNTCRSTQVSMEGYPFKPKSQIMNSPVTSKTPKGPVNKNDAVQSNQEQEHSVKEECKESVVAKDEPQKDEICERKAVENQENEKQPAENEKIDNAQNDEQNVGTQSFKQHESDGILDLDNIDEIDPFKPSKEVHSSPAAKTKPDANLESGNTEVDPFKPKRQMASSPPAKNGSENNVFDNTEEINPFKPKKQMANSPVSCTPPKNTSTDAEEIDPFQPKKQIANSPLSKTDTATVKSKADDLEEIDPFQPKKQIPNLPVSEKDTKTEKSKTDIFEDIDPFQPKNQIANLPGKADTTTLKSNADKLEGINPFKPKKQMQNSPVSKPAKDGLSSNQTVLEEVDPFKPKTQIQNSPEKSLPKSNEIDFDKLDELDPFKPRMQMQNSPDTKSAAPVKYMNSEKSDDVDPFKARKQMMNSPANRKGKVTLSQIVEQEHESSSLETSPVEVKKEKTSDKEVNKATACSKKRAPSQPAVDPFADLNPPELRKKDDIQMSNKVSLIKGYEDTFEVQGVTRRGQYGAEDWGDLEDAQFVPASEVFNDPAAWDMLEKIGNTASKETESALSRMSLYVKFDPLVDPAPSSFINPRRISIRASQLEKVKEYGLDETLLLFGTPPKKRRQSMLGGHAANSNRATPTNPQGSTAGSQPPMKKLEPVQTGPNPVDLILAYSPGKESKPETSASTMPKGLLFGKDDEEDTEENLFQELKYTDADFKKLRTEMRLEAQGVLMSKEREFSQEREGWQREKEEMMQKWSQDCKEYRKLEQIFNMLENTCYEISGAKKVAENKIAELKKENEQVLEDLAGMERSFWDLHKRYEKTKEMFLNLKKNEETLKKHLEERIDLQKKQEEKFNKLKEMSEEKLKLASQEIEKLEQSQKASEEKLKTEKKIADMKVNNIEMKISNLESMLQKKTEDVKQLTEICDGLLAQVGK